MTVIMVKWLLRLFAMAVVMTILWYNDSHGKSLVIDLICVIMVIGIAVESLVSCFRSLFFDGDEDRQPEDVYYGPNAQTSGYGGIGTMAYIATAPVPSLAL